jgi:hypothetical protein
MRYYFSTRWGYLTAASKVPEDFNIATSTRVAEGAAQQWDDGGKK